MGVSIRFDHKKAYNEVERKVGDEIRRRVIRGLNSAYRILMSNTPIWSAETLANYKFGVGARPEEFTPWYDSIPWQHWVRNPPDIASAQANSFMSLQGAISRVQSFADPTRMRVWVVNNTTYDDGEEIDALEFGEIGNGQPLMMTSAFYSMERLIGVAR